MVYEINLDEYADVGALWISMYFSNNDAIYFDNFGVEYVPKEINKFIQNKNIKANILRIQANNSVMCGCFWIGFIDFILANKTLIEHNNLFSPYD